MNKSFIYLWIFIGGGVGSFLPVIFGQSYFSAASIIGSFVGSLAGLWLAIKINRMMSY